MLGQSCRLQAAIFLPIVWAACTGCGFSAAGSRGVDAGPTKTATVEDAHGIPAHKPSTVTLAASEIRRRSRLLLTTVEPEPTAIAELADLIRWLPELAADSELRRAEWDRVAHLAAELERGWAPWFSKPPAGPPDAAAIERVLDQLDEMLRLSPPDPFARSGS